MGTKAVIFSYTTPPGVYNSWAIIYLTDWVFMTVALI